MNDSLNIFIGLAAKPSIGFEKPVEQTSAIPNLGTFSRQPGFSIFMDAMLSYDSLSNILNKEIKGTEFDP